MKRILFFLHFTKIGGAELVAMEYLKELQNKGYKVDLIVDYDMGKEGNTFENAIPKNIDYQYIKSEWVSKLIYSLRTLGKKNILFNIPLLFVLKFFDYYYFNTKIKKLIKTNKYDTTITFFQFLPSHLTRFKNIKHLIWLHGSVNQMFSGKKGILKNSFGKKLNQYDKIITIANEMKEEVQEIYPFISKEKIELLYNPFDFENILSKSINYKDLNDFEKDLINDDYICTVSRLDENQKDITTLIKAYKILSDLNQINEKLYIIGDGIDKSRLEALVIEYSLEKNILFLGKKTNPFIWMKNAKVFILSSKFEGLPTVLIEAMILGKFIIASDCKTGPSEILNNGKCGDLFDVGDDAQLSKQLLKSLNNSGYVEEKILDSKVHIQQFQKDEIIKKLINILEK